jgi:hypothetical protein
MSRRRNRRPPILGVRVAPTGPATSTATSQARSNASGRFPESALTAFQTHMRHAAKRCHPLVPAVADGSGPTVGRRGLGPTRRFLGKSHRIDPPARGSVVKKNPRQGTRKKHAVTADDFRAPRNRDAYPVGRQHRHSQPTSAPKATIRTISMSSGTVMMPRHPLRGLLAQLCFGRIRPCAHLDGAGLADARLLRRLRGPAPVAPPLPLERGAVPTRPRRRPSGSPRMPPIVTSGVNL